MAVLSFEAQTRYVIWVSFRYIEPQCEHQDGVCGLISSLLQKSCAAIYFRREMLTLDSFFKETADSKFEWRDFIAQNNNELLAKLGNFVNRIVKLVNSKIYDSVIPDYTARYSDPVFEQAKIDINQHLKQYLKELEAVNLKDGLQSAMDIAQAGNNLVSGMLPANNL